MAALLPGPSGASGYECVLAHDPAAIFGTVVLLAAVLFLGQVLARFGLARAARPAAWALAVAAVAGVERLDAREPAGVRMLAIIAALLYAMKAVVAVEARKQGSPPLPLGRWLGFAALWPGMRPGPFARAGAARLPGVGALVGKGVLRIILGVVLVALARLLWVGTRSRLLATTLLLPGLSLIVHFGVFDVLAGAWRCAGVDCKPLFRAPLRSTSLGEFWGRRWNLAFSEMTAMALYQPLVRRAGRRAALAASFLGSGLLHELAISVPVRAGYGLPLGYFALHGVLLMVEGRLARSGRPIDGRPWIGRAWTLAWLLVPLPILFHRPFLAGVVWPLIGIEPVSGCQGVSWLDRSRIRGRALERLTQRGSSCLWEGEAPSEPAPRRGSDGASPSRIPSHHEVELDAQSALT